jgi:UDP-N-acetylglucosamine 2-epimerase (non-hydrolysing)
MCVTTLFDDGSFAAESVAIVFGTRPEIIKLAGIIELLGDRARTIFSGQHFDDLMSRTVFEDLQLPAPSVMLTVGGQSRARQIGELVVCLETEFARRRPAVVVVQGDTNTALAGALAANALEIPLVHVEAGLRSFDRCMPEEHNRVVADHLADLCLAPTDHARANLRAERIPDERIALTGNTVVDVASRLLPLREKRTTLLADLGLKPSSFILATFHRPENVDDVDQLRALISHLRGLGLPVFFPVHPRTRKQMQLYGFDERVNGVAMVPPLGYRTFLALAAECAFLLSDSGGVQEEASIVKRPVVVVRRSTERPEVLGTFATLVPSLGDIPAVADQLLRNLRDTHRRLADVPSPYGDGQASLRSVHQMALCLRDWSRRVG